MSLSRAIFKYLKVKLRYGSVWIFFLFTSLGHSKDYKFGTEEYKDAIYEEFKEGDTIQFGVPGLGKKFLIRKRLGRGGNAEIYLVSIPSDPI